MIRANNLWKSYNGVPVLRGLSLHVEASKTTVILGRSGAGKSVLLRQIAGLEEPDQGEIILGGEPLFSGAKRCTCSTQIGMLFQSSALFDSLTVEDNVAFSLTHQRASTVKSAQQIRQEVGEALEQVGLAGYQKKFPAELSGGQKRRAALARLIIYRPRVLLFDEPTAGLDPITAHQIATLISETQKTLQGTAVVVTHDIVSALSIGDQFAFHHEGTIVVSGDRESFFSSEDPNLRHFLRTALVSEQYCDPKTPMAAPVDAQGIV